MAGVGIKTLTRWFEEAVSSAAYRTWRAEAQESWRFYDGEQWSAEERARLAEFGQPAIVINKIAAKVDNLAGVEVSGRTRVIYRSRSGAPDEETTAQALTDLALYVAEKSEQAAAISQVFRDGLVAGIGWLDTGVVQGAGGIDIFCRAEDPLSVVWDPLSRRPDLSDARWVARERWLRMDEVQALFGSRAEVLEAMAVQQGWRLLDGGFGRADNRANTGPVVPWLATDTETYRVVEMQYTVPARQWRVRYADGRVFTTFEKPDGRVLQGSGRIEAVSEAARVRVAYFCGETLLDDAFMAEENRGFSLLPFVYRRQGSDGRPYGLVRAALDPQRELNKRRSKAMHLLNTAQVIADIDAVDDPQLLAREAARPDGLILKRAGKDLRIIRNTDLAASQVAVMEQAARDIQDVIGVYDEAIGKPSNATSGIAIQQRQLAGSLNQMGLFDSLRRLKKQLGLQVLELVRQYYTHEMVVRIVDPVEPGAGARTVKLNERVVHADGQVTTLRDVSAGDYDVVVEEVRDVLSARDDEVARLELLLKAGVPIPPEVLVEASGVRQREKIIAALSVK